MHIRDHPPASFAKMAAKAQLAFILNPPSTSAAADSSTVSYGARAQPLIRPMPTLPSLSAACWRDIERMNGASAPVLVSPGPTPSYGSASPPPQQLRTPPIVPRMENAMHGSFQFCEPEHIERVNAQNSLFATAMMDLVSRPSFPTASTSDESELSDDDVATAAPGLIKKKKSSKKKTRLCKEPGCHSLAVSRRSCVRHGGGSRCTFEGCTNGAKLRNRCFQHGGSTICLAEDCNSKAKRYGYCWSHGGGRICSTEGCVKVAAQGGSCWAHGGGNRCRLEGCSKRSYLKHGYYCKQHASHNV